MKKFLVIFGILLLVVVSFLIGTRFSRIQSSFGALNLNTKAFTLINGESTTSTVGSPWVPITQFKNIVCEVGTRKTGNTGPTSTVQFIGTISSPEDGTPSSTQAQSGTNQWDYIDVIDLEDNSSIDGDTGIVFASSTDSRLVQLNTSLLGQFKVAITAFTTGSVYISCITGDNQ